MELRKSARRLAFAPASRVLFVLIVGGATVSATSITTGDLLVPFVSGSSILEFAPGSLASPVLTIGLPSGYTYTTGQIESVIVRSSDQHIFTNVLHDGIGTVLELDSSGAFVAALASPSSSFVNQLVFDPSDPTHSTVLAGNTSGSAVHEVDKFDPDAGTTGTKFTQASAVFTGLAIDSTGLIYVSNENTGVVEQYSGAGVFIEHFATIASATSPMTSDMSLTGMTFDSLGDLYVGQDTSGYILKFSGSGGYLASFGTDVLHPEGPFYNPGNSLLYIGSKSTSFLTTIKTDGTSAAETSMGSTTGVGIPTIVPAVTVPEPASVGSCGAALLLALLQRRRHSG